MNGTKNSISSHRLPARIKQSRCDTHTHSLEHRRIILIAPNQDLRYATQRLNEKAAIVLRHRWIPIENVVQILEVLQRQAILRLAPATAEPAATAKHYVVRMVAPYRMGAIATIKWRREVN